MWHVNFDLGFLEIMYQFKFCHGLHRTTARKRQIQKRNWLLLLLFFCLSRGKIFSYLIVPRITRNNSREKANTEEKLAVTPVVFLCIPWLIFQNNKH
jgi:hypothetical protein